MNSDPFTIGTGGRAFNVPAGIAKLQRTAFGEQQERNGVKYTVVTYELHLSAKGWLSQILDAGFREWKFFPFGASGSGEVASGSGTDGEYRLVNIRNDGDKELVTAPVPLNGYGQSLKNPTPDTAIARVDTQYDELPFNGVLPLS